VSQPTGTGAHHCGICGARDHKRTTCPQRPDDPRRPPLGNRYRPLAETLARPRWRVLRALQRFDWCDVAELRDIASDEHGRQAFYDACRLALRSGEVERRKVPLRDACTGRIVHATYYRITDKGPRRAGVLA
jgi:hypothetical protein